MIVGTHASCVDNFILKSNLCSDSEDYGLPGSTCPDFGKHDSV